MSHSFSHKLDYTLAGASTKVRELPKVVWAVMEGNRVVHFLTEVSNTLSESILRSQLFLPENYTLVSSSFWDETVLFLAASTNDVPRKPLAELLKEHPLDLLRIFPPSSKEDPEKVRLKRIADAELEVNERQRIRVVEALDIAYKQRKDEEDERLRREKAATPPKKRGRKGFSKEVG